MSDDEAWQLTPSLFLDVPPSCVCMAGSCSGSCAFCWPGLDADGKGGRMPACPMWSVPVEQYVPRRVLA